MAFTTVSIPITDWRSGSHKIKQSEAKVEIARHKLAETSELLALQVEQGNNELNEYYFQVSIAQKTVEQAKENLCTADRTNRRNQKDCRMLVGY